MTQHFDHKISHACKRKANKQRVEPGTNFKIITMAEFIKSKVKGQDNTIRDRAIFSLLAAVGCRVSELLSIRKVNISEQHTPDQDLIYFDIHTLKNNIQKKRTVVLDMELYKPLVNLFYDYIYSISEDKDLLFGISRIQVYRLCKSYFGSEYFPHWFRHYVASFDARSGATIPIMQQKMGWSHMNSAKPYLHLDSSSLVNFQLQLRRRNYTVKAVGSDEVVLNKQPAERIVLVKPSNSNSVVEKVKKIVPVEHEIVKKKVSF